MTNSDPEGAVTVELLTLLVVLAIAAAVGVLVVFALRHHRQSRRFDAHCEEARAAVCRLDGRIDTLDARCTSGFQAVHTRLSRVETRS